MKKFIALLLAALLVFSLAACGAAKDEEKDDDEKEKVEEEEKEEKDDEDEESEDKSDKEDEEEEETKKPSKPSKDTEAEEEETKKPSSKPTKPSEDEEAEDEDEDEDEESNVGKCDSCGDKSELIYYRGYDLCYDCYTDCQVGDSCGELTLEYEWADDGYIYCPECYESNGGASDEDEYCYYCDEEATDYLFDIAVCDDCLELAEDGYICYECDGVFDEELNHYEYYGYDVFFCDDCMELDSVVEELEDAGAL